METKYYSKHDLTSALYKYVDFKRVVFIEVPLLTISIDVYSAGVSLSVVVCVCLVWVTIVGAVVTAVTNIIAIIVVLPGVVHEWTVVLFQKEKGEKKSWGWGTFQYLSFSGVDLFTGKERCEMKRCFIFRPCPKFNVGISKYTVPLLQSWTSVLEFEVFGSGQEKHLLSCWASPPLPPSPPAFLLDSMNDECKHHRTHTHSLVHFHGHIWRDSLTLSSGMPSLSSSLSQASPIPSLS